MASPQSIQAGTQEAWFMFYDSNGDPSGNTPVALANASAAPAYKLRGIQESPSPVPEAEAVPVPGDDTSLGALTFSSDAAREMVLNFGQMDLTLEGYLQNTAVETYGNIQMGLLDLSTTVLATGLLIIQGKAVKQSTGVAGQAGYSGHIYPQVQLFALNRETFSGRTAGVIRYKAVVQMAFNDGWGTTIVDAGGAPIGAYARPFTSSKPLTVHAFRGAMSSITTLKTPDNIASIRAYSDKVSLGVTSINIPTTPLITFTTPAATGRPGAAFYEYR